MTYPAEVCTTSGAHVRPFDTGCQSGSFGSASSLADHSTRSLLVETWMFDERLPVAYAYHVPSASRMNGSGKFSSSTGLTKSPAGTDDAAPDDGPPDAAADDEGDAAALGDEAAADRDGGDALDAAAAPLAGGCCDPPRGWSPQHPAPTSNATRSQAGSAPDRTTCIRVPVIRPRASRPRPRARVGRPCGRSRPRAG